MARRWLAIMGSSSAQRCSRNRRSKSDAMESPEVMKVHAGDFVGSRARLGAGKARCCGHRRPDAAAAIGPRLDRSLHRFGNGAAPERSTFRGASFAVSTRPKCLLTNRIIKRVFRRPDIRCGAVVDGFSHGARRSRASAVAASPEFHVEVDTRYSGFLAAACFATRAFFFGALFFTACLPRAVRSFATSPAEMADGASSKSRDSLDSTRPGESFAAF